MTLGNILVEKKGIEDYIEMWDYQKHLVDDYNVNLDILGHLLLLQHPHTYTLGRSAHKDNVIYTAEEMIGKNIRMIPIDRGGDVTYHGPGQIIGYPIIYLQPWNNDLRKYVHQIEEVIIRTIKEYGITGKRKDAYPGVWVNDKKIAAIGIKFNRKKSLDGYITTHGFALNVNTDLSYFDGIIPCGITEYGVTSMEKELAMQVPLDDVEQKLISHFSDIFDVNIHE